MSINLERLFQNLRFNIHKLFPSLELEKNVYVKEADVVIAYWLNGSFVNPEQPGALQKPIIWRLSDAWPFTGGVTTLEIVKDLNRTVVFVPS